MLFGFEIKLATNFLRLSELKLNLTNNKNRGVITEFLSYKYLPLRFLYIFDISIISTFVKIIKYLDMPHQFTRSNKKLWRYYAEVFGTYFDKKKRSYVLYFDMGIKKKLGFLLSSFMNYPSQSHLLHPIDWHKFSYLFQKTLINYTVKNNIYFLKKFKVNKNLTPVKHFHKKLIPISTHIFYKRFHRCLNLADIDIDPWLTTYDSRFYSTDVYSKTYPQYPLDKIDYTWGVHNFFISSSFFIKTFDTRTILYPELYFKYQNKFYCQTRLMQSVKIFKKKINKNFFFNIIEIFITYYLNKLNINLFKISDNNFNNSLFNNKKYCLNAIFHLLLFIKNNNISYFNIKRNLFIFISSQLKKKFLLKSYFYFRPRKYYKHFKAFICFRSYYARKIPKRSKYNLMATRCYAYITKTLRTFYTNYPNIISVKNNKFWLYFSLCFLKNIKKRFFFIFFDNYRIDIKNSIFNLCVYLRKFIIFNKYINKYFKVDYLNNLFSRSIKNRNLSIILPTIIAKSVTFNYNMNKKIKEVNLINAEINNLKGLLIKNKVNNNFYNNIHNELFENLFSKYADNNDTD